MFLVVAIRSGVLFAFLNWEEFVDSKTTDYYLSYRLFTDSFELMFICFLPLGPFYRGFQIVGFL